MKKNAGFTLVELIVVIAILGILAGVAIPVYSGYISKANKAADLTKLDAVKTAVAFAATEASLPEPCEVTSITVTSAGEISYLTDPTDAEKATSADIIAYLGGNAPTFVSDDFKTTGAKWTAESAEWVPAEE